MPRPTTIAAKLTHLRDLADPGERAAYALDLLASERSVRLLEAALSVLERAADDAVPPTTRAALRDLYERLDENGPRNDAGGTLRAAIARLLRRVGRPADAGILERAALTFEYEPPGREEVAGMLRAAALAALNEVDEALSASYAARLLTDVHTNPMSGEPALTAARVLAAQGQWLPLYAYAVGGGPYQSEVVSECLRTQTRLPAPLLVDLVYRYVESTDELALVGLFDLLFDHPDGEAHVDRLAGFLAETRLYGAYRYLCTIIVGRRHEALVPVLIALAGTEEDPHKWEPLAEGLSLLEGDRRAEAALGRLRERMAGRR